MKLFKIGAAAGALALVASLGLGSATHANAVVAPVISLNTNAAGAVPDGMYSASVSGCSAADGASHYTAYVYHYLAGRSYQVAGGEAPASGDITVSGYTPLPGEYAFDIECFSYAGEQRGSFASANFYSDRGVLRMAGPDGSGTWLTSEAVTLTSPVLEGESPERTVTAFDANSTVTLWVIGPDGARHELGTVTADALGNLSHTTVLPFTVSGEYQIFASGTKTTFNAAHQQVVMDVLLTNTYAPPSNDDDSDDATTPAAPQPKPSSDKPKGLPATGGEGISLVPAAALISVVAGGVAVALRSRRH